MTKATGARRTAWASTRGSTGGASAATTSRRVFCATLIGVTACFTAFAAPEANAGEARAATRAHPSVRFMQKVARELLRAYRSGTIASFDRVLARHADVPAIALYSLGNYKTKLPSSRRALYYRGVRQFMARYFAEQSHKYDIVKAWIENSPMKDGDDWLVRSRVKLASGATYTVVWRVVKRRGRFRIADVKVLGFSLAYLQRGIFHRYLQKKNGDVNALVAALNR